MCTIARGGGGVVVWYDERVKEVRRERGKERGVSTSASEEGRKKSIETGCVETYSSMTVIARHSTMAGCEAGSRGIGEDTEG